MQKDFFNAQSKGGPPSTVTMTSIGKISGLNKPEELSVPGDRITVEDTASAHSGYKDLDLQKSASKVQQYLENQKS